MFRGFYTAGSSLVSNNHKLDIISNNIANVNTTGYKKDLVLYESFEDVLISKVNGSFPASGFEPFRKAEVTEWNGTFNVKADGGYLRVKTPTGMSYSKEANFTRGDDGKLRTYDLDAEGNPDPSAGYPIIGLKGEITVGNGTLAVDEAGNITEDGRIIDKLVYQAAPQVIGTMNGGMKVTKIETDFTQGEIQPTHNQLDFALQGKGFFTVETPEGIRYTRDGSFKLDSARQLVTSEGYPVLGTEGPIVVEGLEVSSNSLGEILVDGELVNRFAIADFENTRDLRKLGEGLYTFEKDIEPEPREAEAQLVQGSLETANVDPVREMVEMMTLFRGYESSQRMIRAYDESIGKAVNEVGRI